MKLFKSLLTLTFAVALSTATFAQGTGSLTASANVVQDITVDVQQNLDFGTILTGDLNGGSKSLALTSSAADSLGKFQIDFTSSNANFILSLDAPSSLSRVGTFSTGESSLPFAVTANYTENSTDPAASTSFSSGEASVTAANANGYVYVGGTLNSGAAANTYNGPYEGTITLSVYAE